MNDLGQRFMPLTAFDLPTRAERRGICRVVWLGAAIVVGLATRLMGVW